jgi:hypothetical protein
MFASVVKSNAPRLPEPAALKQASAVSTSAAQVAKEYAKYQLSFAAAADGGNLTNGLAIIQNYLI